MVKCITCGNEVGGEDIFCKICGVRLAERTKEQSESEKLSEDEVKKTVLRRFEGIRNRNESAIKDAMDKSYNKFDDWSPFRRQEAEEALKNELSAFKILSDYDYETKDFKVAIYGNVALVTLYIRYQGKMRNKPFEVVSRVTTILLRQESEWKIVHEHLSRFPEQRENRFPWF